MGREEFGAAVIGLFVMVAVGVALRVLRKKRASAARFEARQARREQLGAQRWRAQLPAQLDAVRKALERLGLRPETSSRHDDLRSWSHFGLRSDHDAEGIGGEFAGLTGHGEIEGARVALTLSASRVRTFDGPMARLGVLWRAELGARLPRGVVFASDRFSWGDRSVWFRGHKRDGDVFRAVFGAFAAAHEQLTSHENVHVMFEPYTLAEGELWFAYQIESAMDVDDLVEHLERGSMILPTVDWPASWVNFGEACMGMLGEASGDSFVFERLLDEVLKTGPPGVPGRAHDLLVERAGRGDGHAMHLLGQRAPHLVERLDADCLPGLLDAARAARRDGGPYDVSWALERCSVEEWLTSEVSVELRADIIGALGARGVDDERARAWGRDLLRHADLNGALTRALVELVARADNPVLVPGVVSRPEPILSWLAEHENWHESYMPVMKLDYVLRMIELGPERVREITELEPFLLGVLPLAMSNEDGLVQSRVVSALGHVGSRRSVAELHAIEERGLVGFAGLARAARDARGSITERIGDAAHGGLSVAGAGDAMGGLSVATGASGGLTLEDE